jgi:hypothetical protein
MHGLHRAISQELTTLMNFSNRQSYPSDRNCRPMGLRDVEIPHGIDSRLIYFEEDVILRYQLRSTVEKYFYFSNTHSCHRPSKGQGLVRLERLGKFINLSYLFGSRIHDLSAYIVVPQSLWFCMPQKACNKYEFI